MTRNIHGKKDASFASIDSKSSSISEKSRTIPKGRLVPCTAPRNSFKWQLDETGSITAATKNRTGTSSFFVRRAWSMLVARSYRRRTHACSFSRLFRREREEGLRARVLRHSTEHIADIVKASLLSRSARRVAIKTPCRSYVQNVHNSSCRFFSYENLSFFFSLSITLV